MAGRAKFLKRLLEGRKTTGPRAGISRPEPPPPNPYGPGGLGDSAGSRVRLPPGAGPARIDAADWETAAGAGGESELSRALALKSEELAHAPGARRALGDLADKDYPAVEGWADPTIGAGDYHSPAEIQETINLTRGRGGMPAEGGLYEPRLGGGGNPDPSLSGGMHSRPPPEVNLPPAGEQYVNSLPEAKLSPLQEKGVRAMLRDMGASDADIEEVITRHQYLYSGAG